MRLSILGYLGGSCRVIWGSACVSLLATPKAFAGRELFLWSLRLTAEAGPMQRLFRRDAESPSRTGVARETHALPTEGEHVTCISKLPRWSCCRQRCCASRPGAA